LSKQDLPAERLDERARRNAAMREGFMAVLPILVATFTWGTVTGVAMVKSGLTENAALAMTLLVFAGSAQLSSLPLIATGSPVWLIFLAGLVVNLRFIIFGAALYPYFRNLSWKKRLAYGYFTTDTAFVLFMPKFGDAKVKGTQEQQWFFLGAIAPGWLTWQVSSIVGIYLGAMVPDTWSLDFAAVLALMAVAVPLASSRPVLVAIMASGWVAWLTQLLPLRLGLAISVVAGIVAGMLAERVFKKERA